MKDPKKLSDLYNKMVGTIQDKQFVPYVSTWLNQRRFEDEINNKPKEIVIPPVIYNDEVLKKEASLVILRNMKIVKVIGIISII